MDASLGWAGQEILRTMTCAQGLAGPLSGTIYTVSLYYIWWLLLIFCLCWYSFTPVYGYSLPFIPAYPCKSTFLAPYTLSVRLTSWKSIFEFSTSLRGQLAIFMGYCIVMILTRLASLFLSGFVQCSILGPVLVGACPNVFFLVFVYSSHCQGAWFTKRSMQNPVQLWV